MLRVSDGSACQAGDGQVVVIAGGSRGIGRASAGLFARRGDALVLAARDGTALEATAATLRTADTLGVLEQPQHDAGSVAGGWRSPARRVGLLVAATAGVV